MLRVALVQLNGTRDVETNLRRCDELARRAAEIETDWLLLPENAPFLGRDHEKVEVAEPLDGPIVDHFRELADSLDTWVTVGSFPEATDEPDRTYNTLVHLAPDGELRQTYRKLHLFDVDVEGGRSFRESNHVRSGEAIRTATVTERDGREWRIGLSICYDLRFPALYRALAEREVDATVVPSAFTRQTGRDHWHPLLRARAIENQYWLLAPNQWGHHFGDRASYGHSSVYDPWGHRVASAPDGEGVIHAELDRERVEDVRRRMPCLGHVRVRDGEVLDGPSRDEGD
ncbi:MAG: carbon-nitrogen hydrolase family protein [Bradymonadaceae bacterium]